MSDTKLSDLTALTEPAGTDILYAVANPGGTPVDRKMALNNLFTRGAITSNSPIIDAAQTWNSGGVTFTAFKFNITDTASASGSLLMDLQVGGSSQFSISKSGATQWKASGSLQVYAKARSGSAIGFFSNGDVGFFDAQLGGISVRNVASIGFSPNSDVTTAGSDTLLTRRAAANLRLGSTDAAAPVAQTLSVQSVVAGTTNTAGANLTITGSQGTGTGAGGSIVFQVAPAGSSGSAQNALATALTIDSTSLATFAGDVGLYSSGRVRIGASSVNWQVSLSTTNITQGSANYYGFYDGTNLASGGSIDVRLYRDAANTLALRNGANGQTQNVYGTYTDGSNYRRVAIAMTTAGVATLKPEGAGTGASGNVIHISGLPTSNPGPGILWNNAGTPAIGT